MSRYETQHAKFARKHADGSTFPVNDPAPLLLLFGSCVVVVVAPLIAVEVVGVNVDEVIEFEEKVIAVVVVCGGARETDDVEVEIDVVAVVDAVAAADVEEEEATEAAVELVAEGS